MTLESYKFANPESILDKMRWEAAAECDRAGGLRAWYLRRTGEHHRELHAGRRCESIWEHGRLAECVRGPHGRGHDGE